MLIVAFSALGFDYMVHTNRSLVLNGQLSFHLQMKNLMFSIYLILHSVVQEYHSCNHHSNKINDYYLFFSFPISYIIQYEILDLSIKSILKMLTSENPLYCSHFGHVHLFKSSYGILLFSLQNQQFTTTGKRLLKHFEDI